MPAEPAPDDTATPPEEAAGFLVRTRGLVAAGERFRWISDPRRHAYAAVLHALQQRRRAHEHEVPHDELLGDVAAALCESGPYDPQVFRQDLEQLQRWGNVVERVEPTRIQSLADRGRHKLLLRIEPVTARFLDFLEAQANPAPVGLREEGANLLEDVHSGLREARKRLKEAAALLRGGEAERASLEETLLRAAHLVREADQRSDRIAEELVGFGELLARFVAEPFRVEALHELIGWLERYVDRYLVALEEKGAAIRRAVNALGAEGLAEALSAAERCEEERLAASPELVRGGFRLQPFRGVLAGLERFYAPTAGTSRRSARGGSRCARSAGGRPRRRWMDAETYDRCLDRSLPIAPEWQARLRESLVAWKEPFGAELLERMAEHGRWIEQEQVLGVVLGDARDADPARRPGQA